VLLHPAAAVADIATSAVPRQRAMIIWRYCESFGYGVAVLKDALGANGTSRPPVEPNVSSPSRRE
jgi:hypothetical protein